jgi:outer membrane protein assembly factor BamB
MILCEKKREFHFMRAVFLGCAFRPVLFVMFWALPVMFGLSGCTPGETSITENHLPVAMIRSISSAKVGETVILDGSGSYDPDGDSISYQWILRQGPAEVSFADQQAGVTQFVASAEGTYQFELRVSDGKGDGYADIDVEVLSSTEIVETVATPICDPADGSVFQDTLNVTIICNTKGAIIYYTLDESIPSLDNGLFYVGAISLGSSTVLKAIAFKEGMADSSIMSATYTKLGTVSGVTFSPASEDVFQETLAVALSCQTERAMIYYTLDGSEPTAESGTLYGGPITLSDSTTIRVMACKENMYQSSVMSATYTKLGTVSGVIFSPVSGEVFQETLEVVLSCQTEGAMIYYTLDGSEPTAESGILYSGAITLSDSTTIRAMASKVNMYDSSITQARYSHWETVADPQFIPDEQYQFQDSIEVELTCATADATIVYTTDGRAPSREYGIVYVGPIAFTASTTIEAMAYKDGLYDSSVVTAGYVRLYPMAELAFSYASGFSFQDSLDVTISCETAGATIRYTTDGTDPTRSHGETYTGPIRLTATTTLKAMASKYSMIDTSVVSATYSKISGGTQKWTYTVGNIIDSTPAIADNGTIYVGSYDKKLYAFHADGTCKWACDLSGWIFSSPAVARNGTVYIGSTNGRLYAVNSSGSVKWSYNTGKPILSSPAIGSEGEVYIYIDGKLIALNSDGSLKWEYATVESGSYNYSSPVVGNDGTIYIGSVNKKFYAVNSSGAGKWTFETSGHIQASAAIDSDGTIYIGSGDRKLYALNSDGSLKWFYLTGGYIDSTAAVGYDGTIYCGSADYKLYALNSDGTLRWTYTTGKAINASPAIRYDGVVYITSLDGYLYAVNADGSLEWSFATGAGIDASPAIGEDGTVYIGSKDKKFYAIEAPGCLADSPWPKFQYNMRQSGSLIEP